MIYMILLFVLLASWPYVRHEIQQAEVERQLEALRRFQGQARSNVRVLPTIYDQENDHG